MTELKNYCESIFCKYTESAPLCEYITFKVGGPCKIMVFPDSAEKLALIIRHLIDNNYKYFVLGKGSNLLAVDNGYDGVIINTVLIDSISFIADDTIACDCGASLMKVCRIALENSLTGLEFAFGIPGSVGGAVYMNAGAYGGEMKDVLSSVTYLNDKCELVTEDAANLDLSYRHSFFTDKSFIIVSAVIKLKKGNFEDIKSKMDDLLQKRKDKQPLEFPSAGSTFKRPEGYFAGALIEECGLKGYSVGGAQVSSKHAGFIINKGGATAKDIFDLISFCQNKVLSEKGIKLETEVKTII